MSKKQQRNLRSGTLPLFFLGCAFSLGGVSQIMSPRAFVSTGGTNRMGVGDITTVYNLDSSRFLGIVFFLMGITFLYWGHCAIRNTKRR